MLVGKVFCQTTEFESAIAPFAGNLKYWRLHALEGGVKLSSVGKVPIQCDVSPSKFQFPSANSDSQYVHIVFFLIKHQTESEIRKNNRRNEKWTRRFQKEVAESHAKTHYLDYKDPDYQARVSKKLKPIPSHRFNAKFDFIAYFQLPSAYHSIASGTLEFNELQGFLEATSNQFQIGPKSPNFGYWGFLPKCWGME